jgi:hypothetical protein
MEALSSDCQICGRENTKCTLNSRRISEFLEDFEHSCESSSPGIKISSLEQEILCVDTMPFIDTENGLFCSDDFSTALISLNRSGYSMTYLDEEERRKHVFCADQVLA